MKELLIDFIVWVTLWVSFAFLLRYSGFSQWNQGDWTAILTFFVHRLLFPNE